MKRIILILAALAAWTAAAATPNRTATEAYVSNKIAAAVAALPVPDYSTNNTELVETIQTTAPTPDLSPYLRKDKGDSEVQIFGGLLSGFGFHADTGHNDNGWNQYTAHNGNALAQSLPSYIQSNPWGFLKQGEAIPTTGGVFSAYIHLNQKFSVGTWTQAVKPIESVGGSGIAFAFGDNVQTRAANTMVLGVGALNTNSWSFIWNGDANRMYFPTMPNQSNPYATRYNGGFHVNPSVRSGMVNPLQNFWIGDTNLNDWISALAPTPTWDTLSGKPTFATVATSGAYSDLSGKPSIPATAADVGAVSLNGGRMNLGATLSFGRQGDGVDIYSGGIELSDTDDGHTESLFIDYNSITFTKRGESTVYHFPLAASEIGALSNTGGTISNASDASRTLALGKIGLVMTGSAYQRKGQGKLGYIIMLNDGTQREASLFLDDDGKTYINTAGGWVRVPDAPTGGTLALESSIPTVPTNVSAFNNDAGYLTAGSIGGTVAAAVSNTVTTAYIRQKLGVYLYVGEDGGIYVHTEE